jgi:hypothetical protein
MLDSHSLWKRLLRAEWLENSALHTMHVYTVAIFSGCLTGCVNGHEVNRENLSDYRIL